MSETTLLKSEPSRLHAQVLSLPPTNPDAWQDVLQRYLVAASALYVTQGG